MKSIWMSIRSTVTVILVLTLCVFLVLFTFTDKIEGNEALRVLETVVIIVLSYYFITKKRNGEEPSVEHPHPFLGLSKKAKLQTELGEKPNITASVERVK